MQKYFVASITALMLFGAPMTAMAQGEPAASDKVKGPPNADGAQKASSDDTKGSSEKMKGPPNADGAQKSQDPK